MTVLASPEVFVEEKISGLTIFRQTVNTAPADYDTDVGLNDFTGTNVISSAIELYQVTPQDNPESCLRMTIRLNEAWDGADAFVKDMKGAHGVDVSVSVNPFDETKSALSVTGLKNIEKVAEIFRATQFVSAHDGAEIYRQMVNPALLGEALDKAGRIVAAHHGRETADWSKAFLGYGWNP